MQSQPARLLLIIDLGGTFLFAIEGAMSAIGGNLDFFGVMVLAFTTALVGGVVRDLLLGADPPAALRDWRYAAIAFAAGAATFFFHRLVAQIPNSTLMLADAAGLGLFSVAGTEKALDSGMNSLTAVLLGIITRVGGGTVRDIFLAQVPIILRADIYATAALAGAVLLILLRKFGLGRNLAAAASGVACFLLRVASVWRHWSLPHAVR